MRSFNEEDELLRARHGRKKKLKLKLGEENTDSLIIQLYKSLWRKGKHRAYIQGARTKEQKIERLEGKE
jgi:hypothetical protein